MAGLVPYAGEAPVHVFANFAGGQDLEADAGLHGERQHIKKAEPLAPGKRDLLRDAGKRERREGAPTLQLLDEHLTHLIQQPKRIQIERTDDGVDLAMLIEAQDGTNTIVRFVSP